MFISTLKKTIPYLFQARITPLLVGHKGIGKSETVHQIAKENGFDRVIDIKLGNMQDQADLLGLMEFIKDSNGKTRTTYARPDFFPTDPDEKVLFFFDELNRASRQLVQPVMELALEGRHHDYILPAGCRVICAMNPNSDSYLTNDISDAALMDRFCQIKLTPSVKEWAEYMKAKVVNTHLVSFFAENSKLMDGELEEFVLEISPSRRKIEALIHRIVPQKPDNDILQEIAYGLLGIAPAQAFMEFVRSSEKPTSGEEILNNYPKYKELFTKFSDPDNNRADMIASTVDDLTSYLQNKKEPLTDEQKANMIDFLMTIPTDCVWKFATQVITINEVRETLESNDTFIERLKVAQKKVKDAVGESEAPKAEKKSKKKV